MDSAGRYTTTDAAYAAYLVVRGHECLGLDGQAYVFRSGGGLRSLKNEYFGGGGQVGARQYAEALSRLRGMRYGD